MTCKKNFIHDVDVNTITNEQIIALFPSKAVREYLTKINWQFSDREREILYSIKFIKGLKSLRVMKTLKLINGITSLRVMVKAIIKAIPSVFWTFFLLLIFAYVYAIIGTSIFSIDFPNYFGSLKLAFFSLFGLTSINSSTIIERFSWAWIYFVSYNFFEASIIMNVIVGVIVDAVNDSRKEIDEESDKKSEVTLESLAKQIEELNKKLDEKM